MKQFSDFLPKRGSYQRWEYNNFDKRQQIILGVMVVLLSLVLL